MGVVHRPAVSRRVVRGSGYHPRRRRTGEGTPPDVAAAQRACTVAPCAGTTGREPLPVPAQVPGPHVGGDLARREDEDARAGPGDDGGVALRRAAGRRASIVAGYDGRRASWCSQSRVAACRCDGSAVRAWTSRAARPAPAAAAASGTVAGQHGAGRARRELRLGDEDDDLDVGVRVEAGRHGALAAVEPGPVRHPAHREAAVARSPTRCRDAPRARSRGASPARGRRARWHREPATRHTPLVDPNERACAATTPATMAVADEPRPRLCGTPLAASRRRPAGRLDPSARHVCRMVACDEVPLVGGHVGGALPASTSMTSRRSSDVVTT